MDRKEQLAQLLAQLGGNMEVLTAAAAAGNRALTDEEQGQFDKFSADFTRTEKEIANIDRVEATKAKLAAPQPRVVQPEMTSTSTTGAPQPGATTITGGGLVAHNHANHGFTKGFGEYLMSVREQKVTGYRDPRLMVNSVSTFGGIGVGSDGGFASPPQFAAGILETVKAKESFVNALGSVQTSSSLLVVPTDEDAPWHTAGVTAAKTGEGAAITASKNVVKQVKIVMHAIKALVHVSEESLSDIPFLASFVQNKMATKLRWKCENYCVNGTGEDEPLGMLNSAALLSLADDSYSNATLIAPETIFKMKASLLEAAGAFWIVNPIVQPQVWALKSDATAGYPLYTPDMTKAPGGLLLGLPVYVSEACKNLNTQGDIILVSPSGFICAFNGGVQTASTIGFAFDQDLQSFRATMRMGCAPTLSTTVLRADGVNYAAHLVALAARS